MTARVAHLDVAVALCVFKRLTQTFNLFPLGFVFRLDNQLSKARGRTQDLLLFDRLSERHHVASLSVSDLSSDFQGRPILR